MQDFQIISLNAAYIPQAVKLGAAAYESECAANSQMPRVDVTGRLKELLCELFAAGRGSLAVADGKLIGYLAFYPPKERVHGVTRGVFSPLGGNGVALDLPDMVRHSVAFELFAAASAKLVEQDVFHFALSQYASDKKLIEAFVLCGFGVRCSDGIAKLSDLQISCADTFDLVELIGAQKQEILPLRHMLGEHLSKPPIYMPETECEDWSEESIRVFAAKDKGEYIGFMAMSSAQAETYLSGMGMYNICGAYVMPAYRGADAAKGLLKAVCTACEQAGTTHIGVDCETLNPAARGFWGKYFANYTYSFTRRVDERIGGENGEKDGKLV